MDAYWRENKHIKGGLTLTDLEARKAQIEQQITEVTAHIQRVGGPITKDDSTFVRAVIHGLALSGWKIVRA